MEESLKRYISALPDLSFRANNLTSLKQLECCLEAVIHILTHPVANNNNNNNNSNSKLKKENVLLYAGKVPPSWLAYLELKNPKGYVLYCFVSYRFCF